MREFCTTFLVYEARFEVKFSREVLAAPAVLRSRENLYVLRYNEFAK